MPELNTTIMPLQMLQSKPKARFLLLPRQIRLQDGKSYSFSDQGLTNLVTFFKNLGRPLAIDYEHQSMGSMPGMEHFRRPDGAAPAAGWIGNLEVGPEGLWADKTQWTPKASRMLADGEYKYFSPVVFWPKNQEWSGDPVAIGPVGLTNDPDINGLQAVAARCTHAQLREFLAKDSSMDIKKIVAELMGLDAHIPDDQFATACKAWCAKARESMSIPKVTSEQEITALKSTHGSEIAVLKVQHQTELTALKSQAGEYLVPMLVETGRIAPAMKTDLLAKAKQDPGLVANVYKSVKFGAVVPVGNFGINTGRKSVSVHSSHDGVSHSQAFQEADDSTKQLHCEALQYMEEHKVDYATAVQRCRNETKE